MKIENLSMMGLQSGNNYYFHKIVDAMEKWRTEDHEDNLVLDRNQVIALIEGIERLNEI